MMARTPSTNPALPDAGLSDDQINDMLTPEERALLDDDSIEEMPVYVPPDEAAKQDAAAPKAADPEPAGGEDEEAATEGPKAKESEEAPADAGRDDGADPDAEPAPRRAQPETPLIQPVEDVEGKRGQLKELDEKEDALSSRYEDGEVTRDEYRAGMRAIAADRDKIKGELLRAELAQEITKQERLRNWNGEVRLFLDEHPDLEANQTRLASFDVALRAFATSEAAKGMSDRQILAGAHKQWRKDMGFADAAPEQPKKQALPKRPEPPPTLRAMPAADTAGVIDDGEFAGLDRLQETDPLRYQAMLEKMPADKLEAYLRAQ